MTNEELAAERKRDMAFRATPLGHAFYNFRSLLEAAVTLDTGAGWGQSVSDRRLNETWEKARVAEREFRALLDAAAAEINTMRTALEPFAKMASALVDIDKELTITDSDLQRTPDLPNYYLATRDLRAAAAAVPSPAPDEAKEST